MLYDVISMVFQQRQNCKDRIPAIGSQGLEEVRGNWLQGVVTELLGAIYMFYIMFGMMVTQL